MELTLQNVLVLLTLQIAVFGWRINREIVVSDNGRRVWFPVPDVLNVAGSLIVLALAVVWPLAMRGPEASAALRFPIQARAAFSAGVVLLVCHPLAMVAHYGLLNRLGRRGYLKKPGDDYPYFPLPERVVVSLSMLAALGAAWLTIR